MRWVFIALVFLVAVAVSSVSGRPATTDEGRFRVATFNIHRGADRQERYDIERTIEAIARFDADLVGLQEVIRNHAGFGCDDQPALIAAGLRRRTGRPWTYVYARAWNTDNRDCLRSGRGDGVETEGPAFFAPERIIASKSMRLSERRVGLAARVASMPGVSVVVTHLSPSRDNQAGRAREIAALLPWAQKLGVGLLLGDLNAAPEASELAPMVSHYLDSWSEAAERGLTGGLESGGTFGGRRRRIDYVFFDPDVDLELESVAVIDTSAPGLGEVSDHRPVVTTFRRSSRLTP
jgi:endonuclease/exonuclease/phosphatase family metal-dependent hydrolase